MFEQATHELLPVPTHDERARQHASIVLQRLIMMQLMPGNVTVFHDSALPRFRDTNGRDPATRGEIRSVMEQEAYFRLTSSMQRCAQEIMWTSVDETVCRESERIAAAASSISGSAARSKLTMGLGFDMPSYVGKVDHHCMPGGYSAELDSDDVSAGALYERGVFLYTHGTLGPNMDGLGLLAAHFIERHFPGFLPSRILDMGCSIGSSTIGLARSFPDAEVHAIDVGPGLLRYAHARSELQGCRIAYSQQSAEATNYPDGHFSLITALVLLHETSRAAIPRIFAEAHRLLAPGGIFLAYDRPPYAGAEPLDQFFREWDGIHNNEPFWNGLHELDLERELESAGFRRADVQARLGPSVSMIRVSDAPARRYNDMLIQEAVGDAKVSPHSWFLTAVKSEHGG
jgi:2-polyprenyl-3-methyl-5-hydroxy-6-metoxy-1,4-benzoquinol methylase